MKIAHVAPPWIAIPPRNYGGAEVAIANLIEEQVAQGHDVTLFAPEDARTSATLVSFFATSLVDDGVPWSAHLKAHYHYCKALAYVKEHPFDILHLHLSSSSDMYAYPLAFQMHIATPLLATLHSRFPFDRAPSPGGETDWLGDADRYYMEWLAHVPLVTLSKSARAEIPFPLNFVGAIYYGLPLDSFQPATYQPDSYLAWIGRIIPVKGPHHAITAAKALNMPLILAGTVDPHMPETVQYFEEMIKPQIDNQQIRYIGPVDLAQKIELLSHARGFLNPIEWNEPFGLVMLEAMAAGCPVISFARGAAPELLAHGKNGFLVNDVEEMIRFIPELATLERKKVRAHAERHFSIQRMAQCYSEVYEHVIAQHQAKLARPGVATKQLRPGSSLL
jgi:glycosyltransferase involved in cell wall biosynthesis